MYQLIDNLVIGLKMCLLQHSKVSRKELIVRKCRNELLSKIKIYSWKIKED